MVELRKRREAPSDAPQPPQKKSNSYTNESDPSKAATPAADAAKTKQKPVVGDILSLDGFGGEVETQDGETTNLKKLLDESASGVVLFTYPKASTPGCE